MKQLFKKDLEGLKLMKETLEAMLEDRRTKSLEKRFIKKKIEKIEKEIEKLNS